MRFWLVVLLLACACAAYACWPHGGGHGRHGVLAAGAPVQHDLVSSQPVVLGRFTLQPKASFAMTARVLSREDYQLDDLAPVAPVDLALGWDRMSDMGIVRKIRISQSNRLYYLYADKYPIPRQEIEASSANMHMIPADDAIAAQLRDLRLGDVVHVEGFLVDVRRDDGWRLTTSLARNDEGPGASEIVLVEHLDDRQ